MAWIALAGAWADNISAEDITLQKGETKTVNISLTNTESNLVSFQIDLTLPEGISINKAGCSLSNRISDPDQELAIGKQGNNVYRIASTSFALTPISGTSGTLLTLSLTASANSEGGTASLSNNRFFTSNSERVTISDASFNIGMAITFADANVKALCVQNWDTDGDGELSEAEAAAVTDLGEVFKGNKNITSFDELQYFTGLTNIGDNAFNYCSAMTSVTFPNSLTSIGKWSFQYCSGLTSITIPNSVKSIGVAAFHRCNGLTSVTIPESVTSIDYAAFSDCTGLTSIIVENGNNYYISEDGVLFDKDKKSLLCFPAGKIQSTYTIPESVTKIYAHAFEHCSNLTFVTIPDNVTSIGKFAFRASGLTSVTIPNSVTTIGERVFLDCSSLTSVTIPNSVTTIGWNAFGNCTSLTSVSIPSSVTSIGESAFNGCTNLTSVMVEMETPLTIAENTFSNRTNATLYVPAGCKDTYEAAQYWQDFNIVELSPIITFADSNVKALCVQNWDTDGDGELSEAEAAAVTDLGTVFKGNTTITSFDELQYFTGLTNIGDEAFRSCSALTSITIPNSVTSIGQHAFHSCIGLTTVTIPESVTGIGFAAFHQCHSLASVTIPASVTNISGAAFGECSSLSSIVVENGNNTYISENGVLFNKDKTTIICYPAGKEQTEFTIPESVTSIIYDAFSGCSLLMSVTIPNSMTTIGKIAFQNCTGLTSVTIPNSVTGIGDGAFNGCSNLTSVTVEMETPLTIAENTFSNRTNATLYVPAGCKAAYEAANYWKEFKEIVEYGGIEQTLALETLPSMTYGDDAFTLPETTAEGLTLTWTIDNAAVAIVNGNVLTVKGAGTATITATQAGNDSYLPFSREFSLTVGKAALTITANDCTKVEGEENPELTVSYEGFVNDDDASVLTQQPTVTTEATTDSPAGTYPITVSGAEAANYDISYVEGTLTVEEAKIEPTDISQLDNAIYVDPVETVSNSTYALNIKAKNNVTVAGMSFTLTLPDDFSLITDDGGIISTLDSQRASSSKFMVMSSQSGNSYLIRVLPISGTTISGTDGTVLTVRLKNTNAEEGTYELKVNNSSFTVKNADNTFETLPLVDVISTIEITGNLLGDVNGDGNVDLTDAIMIVNHSLDNTPSNFRIDVADVNGDGNIDLTDAIIVVNMSMDSSSMAHQAFMMDLDPE